MAEHEIRGANDDWTQSWAQVGTWDKSARIMRVPFSISTSEVHIGATSDVIREIRSGGGSPNGTAAAAVG